MAGTVPASKSDGRRDFAVVGGTGDRLQMWDFTIRAACIQGIGSGTVAVLESCGYVTAADFVDGGVHRVWNGFGHEQIAYLTNPDSTEWKLPDLGPVRLSALLSWRIAVSDIVRHGPSDTAVKLCDRSESVLTFVHSQIGELKELEGTHTFESLEDAESLLADFEEKIEFLELGRKDLKRLAIRLRANAPSDPLVAQYLAGFVMRQRDYEHQALLHVKPMRDAIRAARRELKRHT